MNLHRLIEELEWARCSGESIGYGDVMLNMDGHDFHVGHIEADEDMGCVRISLDLHTEVPE